MYEFKYPILVDLWQTEIEQIANDSCPPPLSVSLNIASKSRY